MGLAYGSLGLGSYVLRFKAGPPRTLGDKEGMLESTLEAPTSANRNYSRSLSPNVKP